MESRNQNGGTGLRRYSTLRRRSSVLRSRLPMKSNPYVGSFRHAPPVIARPHRMWGNKQYRLSSNGKLLYASSSLPMKSSPYVGWFRHAPPTRLQLESKKNQAFLEQEFATLLESLRSKCDGKICHQIKADPLVSGHLRGGAPTPFPPLTWLDRNVSDSLRRSLHETSVVSGSATVKVLTRLAYWFLFPLAHDATDYPSFHDEPSTKVNEFFPQMFPLAFQGMLREDSEDASMQDEDSDDDDRSTVSEISDELGASISSLAEAYYAHQAAKEMENSELSSEHGHNRLDYVMTQMDVARMARNASRHLDVESILSLPTVTYQSEAAPQPARLPDHERTHDEGWSWMFVQKPPPRTQDKDQQLTEEKKHVCVICLEHFVEGDRLRVLPCDHLFHMGCIDRWLSGMHSDEECYTSGCPTCKKRPELQQAPSPDGSVPSWAFTRVGDSLAKDSFSLDTA